MIKRFDTLSLGGLIIRNIKRWRWRFLLMATLVAGSVSVALLYGSMMESQGLGKTDLIRPLNIPYDVQIQMTGRQRPLTDFPVLASYAANISGYSRGRSASIPVTVSASDSALALKLQTPLSEFEVLGVSEESIFLRQGKIMGSWPEKDDEIYLPKNLAEQYDLALGYEFVALYKNDLGIKESLNLTVSAIGLEHYDLDQAQISLGAAQKISGQKNLNRQFLQVSGFDNLRDFTFFNNTLARLYPGAEFILKETPLLRFQELNRVIQSPGNWVIFLVFIFMAVAVLTLNLLAFLERKQELAIFKTLGIRNNQALGLFLAEAGAAGVFGLAVGLLGSALLFGTLTSSSLSWDKFLQLSLINILLVLFFYILAIIYPLLLAKAAGVNQLLYSREIPLLKRSYDHIVNPSGDWLREMEEENTHILKLSVVDGRSLSVLLRWPDELVKKGETIAFKYSLGGLVYEEWLAPVDGRVLSYNEANGKYIIDPADKDAPRHNYPRFNKRD
ncbi:MAG: ABC transporter permease [Firmicutes bacterium]|nr:ABC transporter permease [Bacillota bacterium]